MTTLTKEIALVEIEKWTEILRQENRRLRELNESIRKQIKERQKNGNS